MDGLEVWYMGIMVIGGIVGFITMIVSVSRKAASKEEMSNGFNRVDKHFCEVHGRINSVCDDVKYIRETKLDRAEHDKDISEIKHEIRETRSDIKDVLKICSKINGIVEEMKR
jgi:hypothetical protein